MKTISINNPQGRFCKGKEENEALGGRSDGMNGDCCKVGEMAVVSHSWEQSCRERRVDDEGGRGAV